MYPGRYTAGKVPVYDTGRFSQFVECEKCTGTTCRWAVSYTHLGIDYKIENRHIVLYKQATPEVEAVKQQRPLT